MLEVLTPAGEATDGGLRPAGPRGAQAGPAAISSSTSTCPRPSSSQVMAAATTTRSGRRRPRSAWAAAPAMWCAPPATASTCEENVDITVTKGHRERSWDGCMLRELQRGGRRRGVPRGAGRPPAPPRVPQVQVHQRRDGPALVRGLRPLHGVLHRRHQHRQHRQPSGRPTTKAPWSRPI